MILKNKSVLVTGGAGFIGSNICEVLIEQNNKVRCLDNFITGKKENISHIQGHPNFELIEGGIISEQSAELDGKDMSNVSQIERDFKKTIFLNTLSREITISLSP